jgi:hypothetical protein
VCRFIIGLIGAEFLLIFNSMFYYICAEPTSTRRITDTSQCRESNCIMDKQHIVKD